MKTRREFLQQAAAVGVAPFASFSPTTRQKHPQRVVIIGAGLAGLVAAYELMRAGHAITLLEARLRPGGRVHTLREFSDGLYAEAGALFIPDHHELTLRYARLFDLTLVRIPERGAARWYYLRGRRFRARLSVDLPLDLTLEERQMGPAGLWRHYIDPVLPEIGDPTLPGWPPESLYKYDGMSFAEFLRTRGASEGAIALLRVSYLDLWGDGIETVSALGLLRDLALRRGERRTYAIRGGNDLLPRAFAERLKEQIYYGAAVTRLEQNGEGVRVFYRQAGEQRVIAADRAICAIPFSCLRRLEIEPPFSEEKQRAIAELPYTFVSRVYLQARRRYWSTGEGPAAADTDLPIMWVWEPTFLQPGPRGILESYTAGVHARKIAALKEGERIRLAAEEMEKVYPGMQANLEGGASFCWDEEEWSRGGYVWFKPGQMRTFLAHITRPEGRIYFAGEHASPWPGWMQGALSSGLRAAREVEEAS